MLDPSLYTIFLIELKRTPHQQFPPKAPYHFNIQHGQPGIFRPDYQIKAASWKAPQAPFKYDFPHVYVFSWFIEAVPHARVQLDVE